MDKIIVAVLAILIIFLAGFFIYRSQDRQIRMIRTGEKTLDDQEIWLRYAAPLQARVLQKHQTIKPEAGGIAKVDLELEVELSVSENRQVSTCWLVEMASLSELEPGKIVMIKFDPKKPGRVFPAVTWARLWIFGK